MLVNETSLLKTTLFPFYQPSIEDWLVDPNIDETLTHPSDVIDLIGKLVSTVNGETRKIDHWIDFVPDGCEKLTSTDFQCLEKYFNFPSSDTGSETEIIARKNLRSEKKLSNKSHEKK